MSILALAIFIVFVTIVVAVHPKTRSLAALAIIGGLIGLCLGVVVALGIAVGRFLGFFNFELPPITIPSFAAFTPGLWLPLAMVVPGLFGGILRGLSKRRATRGGAFSVFPDSQSQANKRLSEPGA